ncbi:MAG: DUF4089 domain-containing protein [Hydrogenophaga sp.]|nr:DUF4089 domain-containing protein [Hydrogenophaga sp.]
MPPPIDAYVDAALALHGFNLGAETRAAVLQQFKVIAAVATPVLAQALQPEDEMAPVFRAGTEAA